MTNDSTRTSSPMVLVGGVVLCLAWAVWVCVEFMRGWDPLALADVSGVTWGHPFLFVSSAVLAPPTDAFAPDGHPFFASNFRTSCAALLAFSGLIAFSTSLGGRACRRLPLDNLTRAERFVFSAGFGLSIVAFAMTVLGLFHLWNAAFVRAVLICSALLCVWFERKRITHLALLRARQRRAVNTHATTWCERGSYALCAVAIAALALLGLVPQSFYDGLVYHQGVPNQWMQNGGISFLPGHFFSNFPLSHGVLGATLRFIGPDVTVGLLQPFSLALSLIALACARKRLLPRSTFPAETLMLLATLTVTENTPRAGNDMFVMMYFSLGILAFVHWRQSLRASWVIALGAFLGAALSAKYTAAPYIVIIAALLTVLRWKNGGTRAALGDTARLGLAALVMPLPWLVKNTVATGNPVWPLLSNAIDTRELHEPGLAMATSMSASLVRSARDLLALPWEVSLSTPDIALLIGPAFLMLLPLAGVGLVLATARSKEPLTYALAVLASWLFWGLTFRASRYASPVMAASALLYAVAINQMLARTPRLVAVLTTAVTTAGLWLLTSYFLAVGGLMHGVAAYHGGNVDTRAYLTGDHASLLPYHAQAMFDSINRLDDDAKVIVLGDNRTFGIERRHISATIFDRPVLARFLDGARDAADLHTRLRDDGVTHIAVNFLEGVRLHRHFAVFDHPPEWQKTWSSFWRSHVDVIEVFDGMVLAKIVPANTTDRRTVPDPIARAVRETTKGG